MKIEVRPFRVENWNELQEQDATLYLRPFMTPEVIANMARNQYSYSVYVGERLVMCAGVSQYWKDRGEAWAFLDQNCHVEFMAIHNVVKRFLNICPIRRIEATVDVDFKEGHRWVRLLGFKKEAERLRAFLPTGNDVSLYARVREQ